MTEDVASREDVATSQEQEPGPGASQAPAAGASGRHESHEPAVHAAQFASLSGESEAAGGPSMDLIMDLEVDLCAELGRTAMLIRDLMELHPGSIIELRKLAGEPVDLLANGKLLARGEVVVVDETFGVRVTEIVSRGVRFGGAS